MTQEEKAKAYDEAREKIAVRFGINVAEEIFSEFEDSEDERIRKELIDIVAKSPITFAFEDKEKVLAWLEKQKQVKNTNKENEEVRQYIIRTMEQKDINVPMVKKALSWLEKQAENKQKQYDIDVLEKHITKDSISELAHTVIVRNGWEIVDARGQKPSAWGKEDDIMVRDILGWLPAKSRPEYNQRRVDWLKSIKSRVQQKQEWNE